MRRTDGYSDGPFVTVRVHDEGDGWSVDAVDAEGGYSEQVWTHWNGVRMDRATAVEHAPEFAAEHAPGVTDVHVIDAKLPICCSCWNKRHPDDPVNTGGPVHGPVEVCQDCGGLTSARVTDVVIE